MKTIGFRLYTVREIDQIDDTLQPTRNSIVAIGHTEVQCFGNFENQM